MIIKHLFKTHGTLVALFAIILVFSLINPVFFSIDNLVNILTQLSINALVAFGMTMVILLGGIDLSVGSLVALVGMAVGLLINSGMPDYYAIIIGLSVGILLGAFNGITIVYLKLQPFIVTLASMAMFRGVTLIISGGIPASNLNTVAPRFDFLSQGSLFYTPTPIIILVLTYAFLHVFLGRTTVGRSIYAIGGNEEVAKLSSVPVTKIKILVYACSGFLSALASVLLTSRLSSAQPTAGVSYELDAIAAVVIGGTSLSGGRGIIYGTLIGALIIGFMNNGLNIIGVSSFYQQFIKGLIILLAVIWDNVMIKTTKEVS